MPDAFWSLLISIVTGGLAVAVVKVWDRWSARRARNSDATVRAEAARATADAKARTAESETTGKIQLARIDADKSALALVEDLVDHMGTQIERLEARIDRQAAEHAAAMAQLRQEHEEEVGALTQRVQGLSLELEQCQREHRRSNAKIDVVLEENQRLRNALGAATG